MFECPFDHSGSFKKIKAISVFFVTLPNIIHEPPQLACDDLNNPLTPRGGDGGWPESMR